MTIFLFSLQKQQSLRKEPKSMNRVQSQISFMLDNNEPYRIMMASILPRL